MNFWKFWLWVTQMNNWEICKGRYAKLVIYRESGESANMYTYVQDTFFIKLATEKRLSSGHKSSNSLLFKH